MKNPANLTRNELIEIAMGLVQILYGVEQPDGSWTFECDKEWSGADVCQDAALLLSQYGLCPDAEGIGERMESTRVLPRGTEIS